MTLPLTRVRFIVADEAEGKVPAWQGFTDWKSSSMLGYDLFVTADTLRAIRNFYADTSNDIWESEHEFLAFGGNAADGFNAHTAPDGVTPLYECHWLNTIFQKYDPEAGRRMDIIGIVDGVEQKVGDRPVGAWVKVETPRGTPDPQGFVLSSAEVQDLMSGDEEDDVLTADEMEAAGLSPNDPNLSFPVRYSDLTLHQYAAVEQTSDFRAKQAEGPVKVAEVTIEYTNGSKATLYFEGTDASGYNGSGTSHSGKTPDVGQALEDAISEAVTNQNLWPTDMVRL